ncbi:MAG: hypothetical protein QOG35_146 [Solirubrobacteraceae bacterium]|jgi:hypothetical protein|nr:hypothetical protein [Solirubrobacteraceae bacterium]
MAQAPQTWILTGSPENVAATREHGSTARTRTGAAVAA